MNVNYPKGVTREGIKAEMARQEAKGIVYAAPLDKPVFVEQVDWTAVKSWIMGDEWISPLDQRTRMAHARMNNGNFERI